jgi:hypothetical protein
VSKREGSMLLVLGNGTCCFSSSLFFYYSSSADPALFLCEEPFPLLLPDFFYELALEFLELVLCSMRNLFSSISWASISSECCA